MWQIFYRDTLLIALSQDSQAIRITGGFPLTQNLDPIVFAPPRVLFTAALLTCLGAY